ncbi:MAG: PDZ domain-containing protein [Acidobacteriota bacterium]|nr:PDZ domain-containing protein [Acidobacteriota bacterium]
MLAQPALSATHVAFVYGGDLWVAGLDGGTARRLTSDEGNESNPTFSADGRTLAFSAQYDGNIDVYTVPVDGGIPVRLTYHPGQDIVQSFTPDGKAVLFTSPRHVFTGRYTQLFTVPVEGGLETQLPIPNASQAAYSPDGRKIVYNPLAPSFMQWKSYRGGTHSVLYVYDVKTHAIDKIPQPATRANDVDPNWVGDTIYFRSDRNGEFNLFAYDTRSKAVRQVTQHTDFPILDASASGSRIAYEQAGYLHMLDTARGGPATRLKVGAAADLAALRPRWARGATWIRSAELSPTGARAAFEYRGEIVTVPMEKGDPRNVTNTPGAHERSPAWSPDGARLAYFSDESGEYMVHIAPQDGRGDAKAIRRFAPGGAGFYELLDWSPDSKRLAFADNSQTLFWMDADTGKVTKIESAYVYSPGGVPIRYDWSPDSKWIAYTIKTNTLETALKLYSLDQGKAFQVTDGLGYVSDPVFDKNGKYLYFLGSTDAGPATDWFAMWSQDMEPNNSLYVAVLASNTPNPLARESDEEKAGNPGLGGRDTPGQTPQRPQTPPNPPAAASAVPAVPPVAAQADAPARPAAPPAVTRVDPEGIEFRILDLPVPAGNITNPSAGEDGQLYFLKRTDGASSLQRFTMTTRRAEPFLASAQAYTVSGDRKRVLYLNNNAWSIVPTNRAVQPAEGRLNIDAIQVRVDPKAEWQQIFNEAWRINRDYFYAPNMHGVDWVEEKSRYAEFLQHVSSRADLNRVLQWMSSELAVGHHRAGGGDMGPDVPETVPGGLLGADYDIANGRYRLKKVFGGLNFNPQLRAPLSEPGVNAKAGEYLLAVDGRDLRPPTNLYSLFENTSGRIVDITIGPNADGSGSRTVQVVPVANEGALRNRDWVEGNLRKVNAATGGRVAYVYVPNTTTLGYTYFKRYFYPQAHKDGIIVDERFNGGGSVADYYIDILKRPASSMWAMRYGADLKMPAASIQGPKALIIDETAGSGGDLFPWMWRQAKLGPIVGKRTWGGLVGTLGFPVLLDGGSITAPNLAFWTAEEGWLVENEGVPPDIEVEQTPADVIAGRDPQLERAIAIVMEELKKNPPAKLTRPAFPERGKTLRGTVIKKN